MTETITGLRYEYDTATDVLTVEGVQYSGQLFRAWAEGGLPDGTPFVLRHGQAGEVVIETTDLGREKELLTAERDALRAALEATRAVLAGETD